MGGFAGFCDYGDSLLEEKYLWMALARRMARRISHRGPDGRGAHVSAHCALAHMRLAVRDPENGAQPMTARREGRECAIVYDGELYNAPQLRDDLESRGYSFRTACDTEVALNAYLCYGEDCAEKLEGAFAFVVDDGLRDRAFLCRDPLGEKPLFYTFQGGRLAFGSEIKALFEFPGVNPTLDREGLCEVFGLGAARTPGCGVFQGVRELKPGHTAVYSREGFRERRYFRLEARPHTEDREVTVERVRELLAGAVERRLAAEAPLCAFLSGGLDSSVIAAIAARALERRGKSLSTYSFQLEGNEDVSSPSSPQDRKEAQAQAVSGLLGASHTTLVCGNDQLADSLFESVIARDLPGLDGSLLYFCRQVKQRHTAALCGGCADVLFGGSPWFLRRELFGSARFPWSDTDALHALLQPDLRDALGVEEYVSARLEETLDAVPRLRGESAQERRMRETAYLSMERYLPALLERRDRCGMWSGLELRDPCADRRLAQYLFNVPWELKCPEGTPKGLLWEAAGGLLPDETLERAKAPSPAPHNPAYEELLKQRLTYILRDSLQPIHKVLSRKAVKELLAQDPSCQGAWPGPLVAGPQLMAYLIQVNYWMLHYSIYIDV